MDVILNKSPSGTWKLPESPRRQFRPWQRLWLVTALVYLLLLAASYFLIMPNQERLERRMVSAVTEEVRRYDGMAFAGEAPRTTFEQARSRGYAVWISQLRSKYRIGPEGNAAFDTIDKKYRESVDDLPVKRAIGILLCGVAWLVPMGALYAMGSVVDWIKTGVRVVQR